MQALIRFEQTNLTETLYALLRGVTRWNSISPKVTDRVAEKQVSGAQRPVYYDLVIPVFRFLGYPGGTAVITKGDVHQIEDRIDEEGLTGSWKDYLASKSPIVFTTKSSGYLEAK